MGVRNYVKNTFKANTNVKGWTAWNLIKYNSKIVKGFVDDIKVDPNAPPAMKETFADAVRRFGLTDEELKKRMRSHYIIALGCGFLALLAFGWFVYLLVKLMFLSSLVALSLSGLMAVYAFTEHFSYYRIKQRRLDCTVDEWVAHFFSRKK